MYTVDPDPVEESLRQSLTRSEALFNQNASYSGNQIEEFKALWEQNARLIAQYAPRFKLLASLAQALKDYSYYISMPEARVDWRDYLYSRARHWQREIDRHNSYEPEDQITLPEYSLDDVGWDHVLPEVEEMVTTEISKPGLMNQMLAASLKTSLFGDARLIKNAFDVWEAALTIYPQEAPNALMLTLIGEPINVPMPDRNNAFVRADQMLVNKYADWSLDNDMESLSEWMELMAPLVGLPIGFRQTEYEAAIGRVSRWVRSLEMGSWAGQIIVQTI